MNLHCPLDYIHFDANFTLNTATLCMLHYLLFLNLSILFQTFYRVYNNDEISDDEISDDEISGDEISVDEILTTKNFW